MLQTTFDFPLRRRAAVLSQNLQEWQRFGRAGRRQHLAHADLAWASWRPSCLALRRSSRFSMESISSILNKVGQFVSSPLIRKIIAHEKSKVKIEEIMNSGKILLCDLSQGKIGEDNATLLGSMIITQMQIAAMNRAYLPESERKPLFPILIT